MSPVVDHLLDRYIIMVELKRRAEIDLCVVLL